MGLNFFLLGEHTVKERFSEHCLLRLCFGALIFQGYMQYVFSLAPPTCQGVSDIHIIMLIAQYCHQISPCVRPVMWRPFPTYKNRGLRIRMDLLSLLYTWVQIWCNKLWRRNRWQTRMQLLLLYPRYRKVKIKSTRQQDGVWYHNLYIAGQQNYSYFV